MSLLRSRLPRRARLRGLGAGLPVLFAALGPGTDPAPAQTVQSFALSADNDGFVFWVPPRSRLDRYYTSGLAAQVVVAWLPPWAGLLTGGDPEPCGSRDDAGPCVVSRLTLGQKIFTPDFIFDADPRGHDRPYAGWLYVSTSAARVTEDGLASLGLEAGVTGEPSLASPVHRWFHRSLNKHEPLGWEHQIPFEPAFLVHFGSTRVVGFGPEAGPLSLAWKPSFSGALGTLRTGATVGLALHGGWNAPPSAEWKGVGRDGFFLRLGMGVEGEVVARDLFLDGSTFRHSVHAERELWVGRLRGRIQLGWGRVGLEFQATGSTLEFRGQNGGHTYGTVRLLILS